VAHSGQGACDVAPDNAFRDTISVCPTPHFQIDKRNGTRSIAGNPRVKPLRCPSKDALPGIARHRASAIAIRFQQVSMKSKQRLEISKARENVFRT
jgi:hypothetical protein